MKWRISEYMTMKEECDIEYVEGEPVHLTDPGSYDFGKNLARSLGLFEIMIQRDQIPGSYAMTYVGRPHEYPEAVEWESYYGEEDVRRMGDVVDVERRRP